MMKIDAGSSNVSVSALFFGRDDCKYSDAAVNFLRFLGFKVTPVISRKRNEPLADEARYWSGDYIFSFRSYVIIPQFLLNKAKVSAINFHPGPPEYPGSGCVNWALYDCATSYGVTAHLINDRIDNGPILECRRFPVFQQDTVDTLLERTHAKIYELMIDAFSEISISGINYVERKLRDSKNEKWAGLARKISEIDTLQRIPFDCPKDNLDRIIRATNTKLFPPYLELHGRKFFLRS